MSNHVHDWNPCGVELIYNFLWWDTDSGNKEPSLAGNDNIDQFRQLTMGVIVVLQRSAEDLGKSADRETLRSSLHQRQLEAGADRHRTRESQSTGGSPRNVGGHYRGTLVVKAVLQVCNLLTQHLRCVANTADDPEPSGIGHGGGEIWTGSDVHASEHDWVLDAKQFRQWCRDGSHCDIVSSGSDQDTGYSTKFSQYSTVELMVKSC